MPASLVSTTHVFIGLFTPATLERKFPEVKVSHSCFSQSNKGCTYLFPRDLFIEHLLYQPCCQSLEIRVIEAGPNCWLSEACVLVSGNGLLAVSC